MFFIHENLLFIYFICKNLSYNSFNYLYIYICFFITITNNIFLNPFILNHSDNSTATRKLTFQTLGINTNETVA